MKITLNLTESLADDVAHVEDQQLSNNARLMCFQIAQEAIIIHKLLTPVLLEEADSWIIERLSSIKSTLDSIKQFTQAEVDHATQTPAPVVALEDASAGGTASGAIATNSSALFAKPGKRKMREGAPIGTTGTTPTTANIGAGGKTPAAALNKPQTTTGQPTQATQPAQNGSATTGAAPNPALDAQNKTAIANNLKKAGNMQLANKLTSNSTSNKFDQNEIAAIAAAGAMK